MYINPLECKQNVFLTGAGGTGKTYAINDYIKNHPKTLLAASTGTAAVNIGGVTVHRLCNVPVPAYGANPNKLTPSQLKIFADAEAVIIDEISMLRNDVFSFAIRVIKRAEELFQHPIRIIVAGDFSQLPPIVKKNEEKYFTKYGFDKSGFCFTTKEWTECKFKVINLTEVKRQSDKDFVENLNKARMGDVSCVPYFNGFVSSDRPEDAIYLCGTNAEADEINQNYLNNLDAPLGAYQAVKSGITGNDLPCDEIVLLKPGCQVMFTANDTLYNADGQFNTEFGDTGRYINGMFATVLELDKDSVKVKTEDGRIVDVDRHKWSVYKYTVDRQTAILKKDEIGYVSQIPLKVAKAVTIHKSQGKTFTKAVISPQVFAAGQLYVALSRVRGPEGLILTDVISAECFKLNDTVAKFYDHGFGYAVSEAQIKKQKEIEKKQNTKKKTKRKSTKKSTTTKKTSVTKKTGSRAKKPTSAAKKSGATTKKTNTAKTSTKKKSTTKKATTATTKKSTARKSSTRKKTTKRKSTKTTTKKK